MKLLLYCTKAKPYLNDYRLMEHCNKFVTMSKSYSALNGKIVAECDYEIEEHKETTKDWLCMSLREKIIFGSMCEKANIDELKCYEYANGKPLYAIHIKNLHIFDVPTELIEYYNNGQEIAYLNSVWENYGLPDYDEYEEIQIKKAPQNMMYVFDNNEEKKVLISIHPEWLCKILNGEKTIEIRKKVLKEMIK